MLTLLDTNTQRLSWWEIRRIAGVRNLTTLTIAAAAVVVVAVVGINLLPSFGSIGGPVESARTSPSPSRTSTVESTTEYSTIDPGRYDVPWPGGRVRLTMPAGWLSATARWGSCPQEPGPCVPPQGGTTLTRYALGGSGPTLSLSLVHDVRSITCQGTSLGPTAGDLATALSSWAGVGDQGSGPIDVELGGYPAKRFRISQPTSVMPNGSCRSWGGYVIWENNTTFGFSIPVGGAGTVYAIDVDGARLVITTVDRGVSAEELLQLEAIIASIEIEPSGTPAPVPATVFPPFELEIGRHALNVAGIPLSFSTRTATSDGWSGNGAFSIGKSIRGPQGAEASILWTSFPDGPYPFPCFDVVGREAGTSAADLAAAVASAPADPVALTGPTDVTVGGRPAKRVVFTVGDDTGCQPGFFFTWPDMYGGPLWGGTSTGDTISVWIIDVDGVLLFIEGITTTEATPALEQELVEIIDSIQFE